MEQSFVAWAKMRSHRLPQVKLGIGDDAALMDVGGAQDLVVTTDTMMEGTHFRSAEVELRRIGRKLVRVNLSDLAAMAAEPEAVFLSMCIPTSDERAADWIASEIYEGVCEVCEQHEVALAGGDTNCWDGPLVLSLTATGRVSDGQVWRRGGAQAEDLIVVTGPLGGSITGKQFDFTPRFDVAKQLRGHVGVHAAMDISDGLSVDLLRMCDASSCGGILELDKIPISDAAKDLVETSGKQPVEHALGDGEDFELLLAIAPESFAEVQEILGAESAIAVGEFTSRTGLWMREGSRIYQLTLSGYVHGRGHLHEREK
ncbi:MAG: thiamine-phosphate kinase [Planctomycetota bacterium]|nr:thiamine-phosphate kinase [Planctomycetota bacterium]